MFYFKLSNREKKTAFVSTTLYSSSCSYKYPSRYFCLTFKISDDFQTSRLHSLVWCWCWCYFSIRQTPRTTSNLYFFCTVKYNNNKIQNRISILGFDNVAKIVKKNIIADSLSHWSRHYCTFLTVAGEEKMNNNDNKSIVLIPIDTVQVFNWIFNISRNPYSHSHSLCGTSSWRPPSIARCLLTITPGSVCVTRLKVTRGGKGMSCGLAMHHSVDDS